MGPGSGMHMQSYVDVNLAIFAFLFGASVGSFLNVVILRVPEGLSIVSPSSRCPQCGSPIRWYDNIPILSFLLLRGKCRVCGERISWRYPFIEAATACLTLGLYLKFDLSPEFGVFLVFSAAMTAVFWIDLDHMIIPDVISLNGLAVGMIAAVVGFIPGVIWSSSLTGAILGAVILYVPAVIYEKVRGVEGLGRGDIKLLAMIGSFIGPAGVIFVLFFSSLIGCLVALIGVLAQGRQSSTPIPFGPFLTGAAVFFVFSGEDVIESFFGLSHLVWQSVGLG
jgi:leader peptidase (prepilin peptidase) / N-methyltransferase